MTLQIEGSSSTSSTRATNDFGDVEVSFDRDGGWRQEGAILDFSMERDDGAPAKLDEIRTALEDTLHAVWRGDAESDDFNRLVIGAGLAWRDITILRAVGKFLRQAAMTFSLAYMQQALAKNPELADLLVELFHARNKPEGATGQAGRVAGARLPVSAYGRRRPRPDSRGARAAQVAAQPAGPAPRRRP